ncbi:hypothetical protein [Nocardia africana]|uniref:DUF4254 domain-containing protein n=1 Tax=Nocardia africana TaxID=134964 RepID=A0A378WZS0_9NOCA|nr:hypothetical protein [Nocardia africana]MCC3312032.1 hypothetical protein [Nocardia africana]SUA46679.1 Uncharacterised protein [Nocardia africana]
MTTSIANALPAAPQLLCAFQGRRFQDRELLRSARALAELHTRRAQITDPILIAEIDCRRGELIDDINEWVERELPGYRTGVALRTDVLGPMVDRMAGSWVAANRAIDSDGARSDTTHKHWYHLAELVDGYTDLVSGVATPPAR